MKHPLHHIARGTWWYGPWLVIRHRDKRFHAEEIVGHSRGHAVTSWPYHCVRLHQLPGRNAYARLKDSIAATDRFEQSRGLVTCNEIAAFWEAHTA